jgi:integrase
MRGHIVKRSKDSYSIKISIGKDPANGKYKYQWVSVKGTKKDAEKRLAELLNQLDNGTFMKPSKTTLGQFLERWLVDYAKPNLSPRGFERYESIVRLYLIPNLGNILLTQIKPEHIQKHYSTLKASGLSASTLKYHRAIIHKALQTAVKWGLINHNAADGVDIPKVSHNQTQIWDSNNDRNEINEMQTWDDFEVRHFLEFVKDSDYFPLFHTALYTGMRRSELLGLKWSDIDFLFSNLSVSRSLHQLKDGSYIFALPKSKNSKRKIELSPASIYVLRKHKEKQEAIRAAIGIPVTDNDLVFSNLDGKPLRPNTVTRAWTTMAAKAGVRVIRFHDARHTHASLLLKAGVHPKIVQERLGHSSIQITLDTYSHVIPGLQEAAAIQFDNLISANYNE